MSGIVVIAEGDTERAARHHLKAFLDKRAGDSPKVRLTMIALDGGLKKREVHDLAERYLKDSSTLGVVALTDLYPAHKDAETARKVIGSWLPSDKRCHVAVAKHDFEAWLLYGWPAILRQARVSNKHPWGAKPEDIDHDTPPAHRLRELFQTGDKPRRYKKTVDGKKLFEQLDLAEVASICPELRSFLNILLLCAGYQTLT